MTEYSKHSWRQQAFIRNESALYDSSTMIDHFLGDAFRVLSCQFWNTVLQCGALLLIHTIKLLDRAVSGAQFLTVGVFECDIAHCRSVAVLCMLYKIRCYLMHPLNDALPGPYAPVWVTLGAMVTHRYTVVLQNLAVPQDFCSLFSVSFSVPTIVFYYISLSLLSVYRLAVWGWGLWTDRVYITLSQPGTEDHF